MPERTTRYASNAAEMPQKRSKPLHVPAGAALIAAVLPLAACGTSSNPPAASPNSTSTHAAAPQSSTAPSQSARGGKDRVSGMVTSVSGGTVQVAQGGGTAAVNLTSATHIAQMSPAQASDVTVGSCVQIRPARNSASGSQSVTAQTVVIGTPSSGQCANPTQSSANRPGRGGVRGTVTAVNAGSVSIADTTVTLTPNTTYEKRTPATVQAVSNGQCLSAQGTNDAAGTLQATTATVRPPVNGQCPHRR